jgi:hypothetical protein
MNNYLNSQTHRYGIFFTIFICSLTILLGLNKISWMYLLPSSYAFGCLIGYLKSTYHFVLDNESSSTETKYLNIENTKTSLDKDESTSLILKQLLLNLSHLEQRVKPFLKPSTQNLITEIDKIMQLMSNKLDQSDTSQFKFEISDIQRTLSNYLTPALEYYCELPKFLHHRKITNSRYTPHELIELQLQIILKEMTNIAESIYQNDLNQLEDHGQFLKQKLQHSEFFKTLPPQD